MPARQLTESQRDSGSLSTHHPTLSAPGGDIRQGRYTARQTPDQAGESSGPAGPLLSPPRAVSGSRQAGVGASQPASQASRARHKSGSTARSAEDATETRPGRSAARSEEPSPYARSRCMHLYRGAPLTPTRNCQKSGLKRHREQAGDGAAGSKDSGGSGRAGSLARNHGRTRWNIDRPINHWRRAGGGDKYAEMPLSPISTERDGRTGQRRRLTASPPLIGQERPRSNTRPHLGMVYVFRRNLRGVRFRRAIVIQPHPAHVLGAWSRPNVSAVCSQTSGLSDPTGMPN